LGGRLRRRPGILAGCAGGTEKTPRWRGDLSLPVTFSTIFTIFVKRSLIEKPAINWG